uniref:Uncharacterized protein n=1 Tax=Cyprinodon variegatus TaxID=28743 RepID=A0A3Q2CUJ5_CYPVA
MPSASDLPFYLLLLIHEYKRIACYQRGKAQIHFCYCNFSPSLDPVSYYNPLHNAVLRNKPDMVRLLVEHGADIEKRDRIHGSSPLDLASEESERLPCLITLLDLGADVNATDKHGMFNCQSETYPSVHLCAQNNFPLVSLKGKILCSMH